MHSLSCLTGAYIICICRLVLLHDGHPLYCGLRRHYCKWRLGAAVCNLSDDIGGVCFCHHCVQHVRYCPPLRAWRHFGDVRIVCGRIARGVQACGRRARCELPWAAALAASLRTKETLYLENMENILDFLRCNDADASLEKHVKNFYLFKCRCPSPPSPLRSRTPTRAHAHSLPQALSPHACARSPAAAPGGAPRESRFVAAELPAVPAVSDATADRAEGLS